MGCCNSYGCKNSHGAKDAEIERLRSANRDLDQVIADIASEVGCKPDNEAILERIDRMRTALSDVRRISSLDNTLSEQAGPIVFCRMGEIHQHADAALTNEQNAPEK